MLLRDAILAYLHYISIIATASTLVAEMALCRPGLDQRRLQVLGRVDLWYLFAALAALASGFSRAVWGAKGWEFYSSNPVFWVKISLFVAVGLISIVPTIRYIRWAKMLAATPSATVADGDVANTSHYIYLGLALLALVPLLAALMSRGFGY